MLQDVMYRSFLGRPKIRQRHCLALGLVVLSDASSSRAHSPPLSSWMCSPTGSSCLITESASECSCGPDSSSSPLLCSEASNSPFCCRNGSHLLRLLTISVPEGSVFGLRLRSRRQRRIASITIIIVPIVTPIPIPIFTTSLGLEVLVLVGDAGKASVLDCIELDVSGRLFRVVELGFVCDTDAPGATSVVVDANAAVVIRPRPGNGTGAKAKTEQLNPNWATNACSKAES